MRSTALYSLSVLTIVLAASGARADIPPAPPAAAEYAACLDKDAGESCETQDGVRGTCVVVQGGPYGMPWARLVCLNGDEIERGREEGWIAERGAASDVAFSRIAFAAGMGMLALALAGAALRRKSRAQADAS